mmetsp:Transcript_13919/g.48092  ORF Transcript_13919/g.48092 Transcript_13919/m.48092 type:complete len:208 (-) Transcript_13919:188-811(-)
MGQGDRDLYGPYQHHHLLTGNPRLFAVGSDHHVSQRLPGTGEEDDCRAQHYRRDLLQPWDPWRGHLRRGRWPAHLQHQDFLHRHPDGSDHFPRDLSSPLAHLSSCTHTTIAGDHCRRSYWRPVHWRDRALHTSCAAECEHAGDARVSSGAPHADRRPWERVGPSLHGVVDHRASRQAGGHVHRCVLWMAAVQYLALHPLLHHRGRPG